MGLQRFVCRFGWVFMLGGGVLGWHLGPGASAVPMTYAWVWPAVALVLLARALAWRRRSSPAAGRRSRQLDRDRADRGTAPSDSGR
jgi:hypothetical protein